MARGGSLCLLPLSALEAICLVCFDPVHATIVYKFLCASVLVCQEDTVFLVSFMSSGLNNLYACFSAEFSELGGGRVDKDFPFRTE